MSRLLIAVTLVVTALLGCGGGGGGGSPAAAGFSESFVSSAAAGEVISFDVNTSLNTYTYTILKSSYGLPAQQTGSGTLTSRNSDGSYNISASGDGFVRSGTLLPIKSGLLSGSVSIDFGGGDGPQTTPIFGVSNPVTSLAQLAGTYNWIDVRCDTPSYGLMNRAGNTKGCNSDYGTITVDTNGAYFVCLRANLTTDPTCATGPFKSPGVVSTSSTPGVFNYLRTFQVGERPVGSSSGSFTAFVAPNGQKVAFIDLSDTQYGYGQMIMSTQTTFSSGDADGDWSYKSNFGSGGLLNVNGLSYSNNGLAGALTANSPWQGFVSWADQSGIGNTGFAILAGSGVYVSRISTPTTVPSKIYYEVGIKK